jgi:DNA-binding MarR family transcriptional regulator
MQCPKCKVGICQIKNLSKKYAEVLNAVRPELLLPVTELGILQTLHSEKRPLFPKEISAELDCSYQLVGKRGKILDERGLVVRTENEQGRRLFEITHPAEQMYFTDEGEDGLNISE